jgi:hypothetical protein
MPLPGGSSKLYKPRLAGLFHLMNTLEPRTRKLIEGWPLEAICLHLEAITFGDIKRVLINVPPGFMKSLLTDVFSKYDAVPREP